MIQSRIHNNIIDVLYIPFSEDSHMIHSVR